jgi:hypothetical protein
VAVDVLFLQLIADKPAFARKELHDISARATAASGRSWGEWRKAYRRLAKAADELDMRWDQCEMKSKEMERAIRGCLEIRFTEHEVRE